MLRGSGMTNSERCGTNQRPCCTFRLSSRPYETQGHRCSTSAEDAKEEMGYRGRESGYPSSRVTSSPTAKAAHPERTIRQSSATRLASQPHFGETSRGPARMTTSTVVAHPGQPRARQPMSPNRNASASMARPMQKIPRRSIQTRI